MSLEFNRWVLGADGSLHWYGTQSKENISLLTTCVLITSSDLYTIKPEVIIIIIYNIL
jgi:GTP:adenosylcobinamide-phosphate guanylyltransferase